MRICMSMWDGKLDCVGPSVWLWAQIKITCPGSDSDRTGLEPRHFGSRVLAFSHQTLLIFSMLWEWKMGTQGSKGFGEDCPWFGLGTSRIWDPLPSFPLWVTGPSLKTLQWDHPQIDCLWGRKSQSENPVFLSLGYGVWDFSFIFVKTLPCVVLREADPWLFFLCTKWAKFWFWLSQLIKKNVLTSFTNVYIKCRQEQGQHFSMPGIGSCSLDSEERNVLRAGVTCPRSCS